MAIRSFGFVLVLLLAGPACAAGWSGPPKGYVPDAVTAIAIAEAVLVPIYGEEHIRRQEPFSARLDGDNWIVLGNRHCTSQPCAFVPAATVSIARHDGRILFAMQTD